MLQVTGVPVPALSRQSSSLAQHLHSRQSSCTAASAALCSSTAHTVAPCRCIAASAAPLLQHCTHTAAPAPLTRHAVDELLAAGGKHPEVAELARLQVLRQHHHGGHRLLALRGCRGRGRWVSAWGDTGWGAVAGAGGCQHRGCRARCVGKASLAWPGRSLQVPAGELLMGARVAGQLHRGSGWCGRADG